MDEKTLFIICALALVLPYTVSGLMEIGCYTDTGYEPLMPMYMGFVSSAAQCVNKCKQKRKPYAGIWNGGKCYCDTVFETQGTSALCNVRCKSGDKCGSHIAVSIYAVFEPCKVKPCKNGGTCATKDYGKTFMCACTKGYLGKTCVQVDYCEKKPCKNGGTCTTGATDYKCSCKKGFLGKQCGTVDYCANEPCQNGGTCTTGATNYTCSCKKGFFGDQCGTVDYCAKKPCKNGGTCTTGATDYTCSCKKGFLGNQCGIVDPCVKNPCKNGTTCKVGVYKCSCKKSSNGKQCEAVDPCAKNPCKNGGTCEVTKKGYKCSCKKGFLGQHCLIVLRRAQGLRYKLASTGMSRKAAIRQDDEGGTRYALIMYVNITQNQQHKDSPNVVNVVQTLHGKHPLDKEGDGNTKNFIQSFGGNHPLDKKEEKPNSP